MVDQQGCPACGGSLASPFHHAERVPAASCLLLDSADEARNFPNGRLELAMCRDCGFITNIAFDPALTEYSDRYEETQGFSARFVDFARSLAKEWVERHDLQGREVLEIGCGKGDFLVRLVERTGAIGIGIDPAYRHDRREPAASGGPTFIAERYGPAHTGLSPDYVCCRHTLEHIQDVLAFLGQVRSGLGDRKSVVLLFELPDTTRILDECAFWDVYYEHCSYFTAGSLARLFRRAGFAVEDLYRVYDDQYLVIEARPAGGPSPGPLAIEEPVSEGRRLVAAFASAVEARLAELRRTLDEWQSNGKRVVLWGSGSKAVAYLTGLGVGSEVEAVIDINPHKAGKYLAGTGHKIEAADALVDLRPDVVLVMNPVYQAEIGRSLAAMGLTPSLHALT